MIQSQILQPVVVLLAWTMIMWLWMYATRIPAMSEAGIEPNDARRTKALDETLLRSMSHEAPPAGRVPPLWGGTPPARRGQRGPGE